MNNEIQIKDKLTENNAVLNDISVKNCNLYYGDFHALKDINVVIPEKNVTAFIGPSGCGKSTFLKCFNRMNDLIEGCKISGEFKIGSLNIYDKSTDVNLLRKNVGMVFQKPNPFQMSVYDNIAFAPRTFGIKKKAELDEIVETSLKKASIWDEVKDRLKKKRARIKRRTATTTLHRPRPCRLARNSSYGRTDVRARSHLDRKNRRTLRRTQKGTYDNNRNAQYGTSHENCRQNRVFPHWRTCGIRRHRNAFRRATGYPHRKLHHGKIRLIDYT